MRSRRSSRDLDRALGGLGTLLLAARDCPRPRRSTSSSTAAAARRSARARRRGLGDLCAFSRRGASSCRRLAAGVTSGAASVLDLGLGARPARPSRLPGSRRRPRAARHAALRRRARSALPPRRAPSRRLDGAAACIELACGKTAGTPLGRRAAPPLPRSGASRRSAPPGAEMGRFFSRPPPTSMRPWLKLCWTWPGSTVALQAQRLARRRAAQCLLGTSLSQSCTSCVGSTCRHHAIGPELSRTPIAASGAAPLRVSRWLRRPGPLQHVSHWAPQGQAQFAAAQPAHCMVRRGRLGAHRL